MIRSRSDLGASTGSSSEDDIPLEEKRQAIKDAAQMVFEVDEERGISPPPDWMSQKQTPSKAEVLRKDSDDVSESPLLEEERVAVGEGNISRKKRKAAGDAGLLQRLSLACLCLGCKEQTSRLGAPNEDN